MWIVGILTGFVSYFWLDPIIISIWMECSVDRWNKLKKENRNSYNEREPKLRFTFLVDQPAFEINIWNFRKWKTASYYQTVEAKQFKLNGKIYFRLYFTFQEKYLWSLHLSYFIRCNITPELPFIQCFLEL